MDELFIRGITKLSGYLYHCLHIHEWFTRDTALPVPLICMAAVVQWHSEALMLYGFMQQCSVGVNTDAPLTAWITAWMHAGQYKLYT